MSASSRGALRMLLALGYGGGIVLLLLLLTKDNIDLLTARVGYTALGVIVFGLVAAAGARLFDRSNSASLWGWATVLIAIVTFVLTMVEIWPDDIYPNENRTLVMVVISLLLGGGSLVLSVEPDEASEATRVASRVALAALVAFGVLAVLLAADVEIGARWFGVASAVFLIAALSLPVLQLATEERDDAF